MTDFDEIIEGLAILKRYATEPRDQTTAAEHDMIYFGGTTSVTLEDAARLDELGFHIDDETDSWFRFT